MKIDGPINRLLRKLWPEDERGERKVRFHSQNLNEDRQGNPKGLPYEGRAWLNTPMGEFRFEWHLWRLACGFGLQTDSDTGGTTLNWAVPPVSLWLTTPLRFGPREYASRNYIDLSVHDAAVWWQFGGDRMSWSSKTPKWKNGNFKLDDFFLGKQRYVQGSGTLHRVKIPMPEGSYDAEVELREDRWERPRWRTLRLRRASVNVPQGIPHAGKGENSWDCGEDRLWGWSGPAENIEDAIAKTVQSVLRSRRRYDGNVNAVYPPPEVQAADVARMKKAVEGVISDLGGNQES